MSPQGLAAELFDRIRTEHLLLSSSELLAELSRVLRYERVLKLHRLDDKEIDAFVRSVEAGSIVVPLPADIPAVVKADPDDDLVVATAILGEADAICTRNRHLYALDVVQYLRGWSIEIIDDLQLMGVLRGESRQSDEP
jgi:predicted nucleic acid-binding protein